MLSESNIDDEFSSKFHMTATPTASTGSRLAPSDDGYRRVMKETEVKCSKMLADAEHRIIDERTKFHEREMSMKEDLLKERSRAGSQAVSQQKVQDLLAVFRKQAEASSQAVSHHHTTVLSNVQTENQSKVDDLFEKVQRLERQLQERDQELQSAENRHQHEKKELLALRTSQLKMESTKKGQEGEMVNRAMATISEYEAAVRKSESENAARLAEYIDRFTKDWVTRAKEFEDHKARFEAEVMDKAFHVLREQETDLSKKEEHMKNKMVELLGQQSDSRLQQEQQLLQQFENFKMEYKELQDRDFNTRCSLFDAALEKREKMMLERLSAEREKLIENEQTYANAAEMQRVTSLNEAMSQVAEMREQVLSENQKRQDELHRQLLKQREQMHSELVDNEKSKTEQMSIMQERVVESMNEAHRVVASVKQQMVVSEADIHEKYIQAMEVRNQQIESENIIFKESIERDYFDKLTKLNSDHAQRIKGLQDEHIRTQHNESGEAFKREQELRMSYDQKQQVFEEQLQQKYKKQLQEAADNEAALKETISMLKREISDVNEHVQQSLSASNTRVLQLEARLAKSQREIESAKSVAEEELRARYDKWLEDALATHHRENIDRHEFERMKSELEATDSRCSNLIKRERDMLAADKEMMKEMCDRKVREERQRVEDLEKSLLEKVADMRVELEAEMKRKEAANQRVLEAERRALHDEATERGIEERRERANFEERVKEMAQSRWKAVNKDIQDSCDAKAKLFEAKMNEREAELDKRDSDIRNEVLRHHQKSIEDKQRLDSQEWDIRTRLELEIRKEAEGRLATEREKLKSELDAIRKHASEQQKMMEETRKNASQTMSDEKRQAEEEMKARYEGLLEAAINDHRQTLKQRETAFQEKDESLRQKLQSAASKIEELHKKETDALQQKLDGLRTELDEEKSHYEKEMRDSFRQREEAIRTECQATIKAEQDSLRQRELQLSYETDRARLEIEAGARETMQNLLDGRTQQWDEAAEERKRADQEFMQKLQAKLSEKDSELLIKQKKFEDDMRAFTEASLVEQKAAHDAAVQSELSTLRDECTKLRMELQKQRQIDAIEDTAKFETRVAELRQQNESVLEDERKANREAADRLIAEAQKRADSKNIDLRREYDSQLSTLREQLQAEKDQAQISLLRKDEDSSKQQEKLSEQLQTKMDGLLSDLKNIYERKWRAVQEGELEKAAEAERQKASYETKIKDNYENLLKEMERSHTKSVEERDHQRALNDREKDRTISSLKSELEMSKIGETDVIDKRVKSICQELERKAESEKQDYLKTIESEREHRDGAERNSAILQAEVEKLSSSMNQWKLDLHKSLVSKYEQLFNDVQARSRKDREAFARKLLEEEERRLARELIRKDSDISKSRAEAEKAASKEVAERESRSVSQEMHSRLRQLLDSFGSKQEKLHKLWELIDTDPSERIQLLTGVFNHLSKLAGPAGATALLSDASPSRDQTLDLSRHTIDILSSVYEELCAEIQRLEAQLPLMDVITRREFVKHRIAEVTSAAPSALKDQQLLELRRELHVLNEQLLQDLPRYEQDHNAKLFYKNQRYLFVMEQDLQHEASHHQHYLTHAP